MLFKSSRICPGQCTFIADSASPRIHLGLIAPAFSLLEQMGFGIGDYACTAIADCNRFSEM
jgi:hypothetical protein